MNAELTPSLDDLDFASAGKAVLDFLQARFGFGLWMLTRTEGDDWIVLQVEDRHYGVTAGTVFSWADSFCSRMVNHKGPRIAPDSDEIPAYLQAPIREQMEIKAYVGVPLNGPNGELFGTLCAIDPSSQPEALLQEQPLVELQAALLSTILKFELLAEREQRRSERLLLEAQTDALTGLANRRAWDQVLAKEEERCQRYGHPAAVLMLDLNGLKRINDAEGHAAGDELIQRAAQALRGAVRDIDVVARLGGDEFAVLAIECDRQGAEVLVDRLRQALTKADVQSAIGLAVRRPSDGLLAAVELADERMYADKRLSGSSRG